MGYVLVVSIHATFRMAFETPLSEERFGQTKGTRQPFVISTDTKTRSERFNVLVRCHYVQDHLKNFFFLIQRQVTGE